MLYFAAIGFSQAAEAGSPRAAVFNVKDFGAKGSARLVHDAGIANGSSRLTSAKARFTSADMGQSVYIVGAGPRSAWTPLEADLSRWAGRKIKLKLMADVGPHDNSSGDWACWSRLRLESLVPELQTTLRDRPVRFTDD